MNMIEISVQSILVSLIHKRCELMTIFVSNLHAHVQETELLKTIKFTIGYLQMDNQTESEPIYPVILKPRDLDYNNEMN